ncbi:MAG: hypothetical protein JSW45_00335 [Thiotrichales bacterium]|nr:MAG: hypothetical protein JSW45_00335 [Thiotrichales bacterium]
MKISAYEFGKISIGDASFTSDVIITPDRVIDSWWRKQGHELNIEDLDEIVQAKPEVLIVGTGYYGRLQVPEETRRYLKNRDIELIDTTTREAVPEFNRLQQEYAHIVAALHLTC